MQSRQELDMRHVFRGNPKAPTGRTALVADDDVLVLVDDELVHHAHARLHRVHSQVLHVAGEPLVEPQVVPPRGRDQVAEPLGHHLVVSLVAHVSYHQFESDVLRSAIESVCGSTDAM